MSAFDRPLIEAVAVDIVGRRSEIELIVAGLGAARHVVLEGPPGTGKSSLLRAVARHSDRPFVFVEGNAELTPARLGGHFDPAGVIAEGYQPECFVDGPLLEALRTGALLYIEEINRVPEETLNLLITTMSEREITVPRLGRIEADPQFRLVAAMNPFDSVGTARISGALYDRMCRVAMDYQSAADEVAITAAAVTSANGTPSPAAPVGRAVMAVRASREHPELAMGSSVRGAIDLVLVGAELAALRDPSDATVGRDAARVALSGRIRRADAAGRRPEDIVDELWAAADNTATDGTAADDTATDGTGADDTASTGARAGEVPPRAGKA